MFTFAYILLLIMYLCVLLGMIQVGDEVHEVNGIPVQGRNIEQVVHILVCSLQ